MLTTVSDYVTGASLTRTRVSEHSSTINLSVIPTTKPNDATQTSSPETDTVCCGSSSTQTILSTDTIAKQGVSRNELMLIGIGGGCFSFFLLVIATATAVICCVRCIKSKREGK